MEKYFFRCLILVVALCWPSQVVAQKGADSLAGLKRLYQEKIAEAQAVFEKSEAMLAAQYSKRLDTLIAGYSKAADLEGALAAKSAKQNVKIGEASKLPDSAPKTLLAARAVFEKAGAKILKERRADVLKLKRVYTDRLNAMLEERSKAGDAAAVAAIGQEIGGQIGNGEKRRAGKHDRSVERALDWLAEKQNQDGSWGTSYPVALTGFAVLGFTNHGVNVASPRHGATLTRGIEYLIAKSKDNRGLLTSKVGQQSSYEHGIATYALAEVARSNQGAGKLLAGVQGVLKQAVRIIVEGQTEGGGWLYSYGRNGIGDLSVSGWNIQALKAAQNTGDDRGIEDAIKKAQNFLKEAATPEGLYRYRVTAKHKGRLSLTGLGVSCARILGKPAANEDRSFEAIAQYQAIVYRKLDLYALFYHTLAYAMKGENGRASFNDGVQELIVAAQERDGNWPTSGGHIAALAGDAPLYHTCLCILILDVDARAARFAKP